MRAPCTMSCLFCLLTMPCGVGLLSNFATLYKEDGNYCSAAYFLGLTIEQHKSANSPAQPMLERQHKEYLELAKFPVAAIHKSRCV